MSIYVKAMIDTIEKDEVEILGYTVWGCIDVISAATGEMPKCYGLVYVDKDDERKGSLDRFRKNLFVGIKM